VRNLTSELFRDLFETEMRLGVNADCETCDAGCKRPLLPWIVGDAFEASRDRLVFIGKPHRANPEAVVDHSPLDPTWAAVDWDESVTSTPDVEMWEHLWNTGWPYWRYTREICRELYGEDGEACRHIAMTNIIKCSSSNSTDETTSTMMEICVDKLGVVWREIERLKATTLVFYTHGFNPPLPRTFPIAVEGRVKEITGSDYRVTCGMKALGWWEREFAAPWSDRVRSVVVGHPERKKKDDFVRMLVEWIRDERTPPECPST